MKKTAYVNGILLDGNLDMKPQTGMAILVDGETIEAVLPEKKVTLTKYKVVDLKGAYIMPGLINLHAHLPISGKPSKSTKQPNYGLLKKLFNIFLPAQYAFKKMGEGFAEKQLLSGVTTLRTVGGLDDQDGKLRDKINKGKKVGPRLLVANTGVSVPGGHFAAILATEAKSPEDARRDVRKIAKTNPDLIKLMITGGVMDAEVPGEPGVLRMAPEIVKAACDEAHKLGYMVAAHVESSEGVRVALQNGVDTVEHGGVLDDDMIRLFKERGAADICTISPAIPYVELPPEVSYIDELGRMNAVVVMEGIITGAKQCLENDIPVGLGTDSGCPFVTQYDMWRELYYFTRYVGVSNSFALYTATKKNAEIVHIDDITGTIETGKSADMIVCAKNPLEDITVLRNLEMVIMKGKQYTDLSFKKDQYVEDALDSIM